jgi:hypothetical protein
MMIATWRALAACCADAGAFGPEVGPPVGDMLAFLRNGFGEPPVRAGP